MFLRHDPLDKILPHLVHAIVLGLYSDLVSPCCSYARGRRPDIRESDTGSVNLAGNLSASIGVRVLSPLLSLWAMLNKHW